MLAPRLHRLAWLVFLGPLSALAAAAELPSAPVVFLLDATDLIRTRSHLAHPNSALQPAFSALRRDAEAALKLPAPSVMDKPLTAASGDKHDYLSFGPYWWPDPARADGLPYVRRDGEVNPASRIGTDDRAFGRVCTTVETLALTYWFTGDDRFAAQASRLVRVWFLDPATRMNPNLQHAQAIPGITDGRGIGIIESRTLMRLNDAVALLADSPAWTATDRRQIKQWLTDFFDWLTQSSNGRDEQAELNNHGTWYDAQVAHLALVLGKPDYARKVLSDGLSRRLAAQVAPDGGQPHELARTNSLSYSLFNLEALFSCARLASHVNVDWWSYSTPDGRSLGAAIRYLAPYIDPDQRWTKADLHEADRGRLPRIMYQYLRQSDDATIAGLLRNFSSVSAADARWRLTDHQPPEAPTAPPAADAR